MGPRMRIISAEGLILAPITLDALNDMQVWAHNIRLMMLSMQL